MVDIIIDTIIDGIKLIPFLFIAFLIIEFFEHKMSKKGLKLVQKSGRFGPIVGSILGLFPQCGFSVLATNLYSTRIITLGTLISIYLSTSDEMLPILISRNVSFDVILNLLLVKFIVGFISGTIIDLVIRKKEKVNYEICEDDNCHCEGNIFKSTIKHTLNTLAFILFTSFIINIVITFLGEDNLARIFMKDSIFGPFLSSLIGLIPNCASSIMISELYLNGAISFASASAGLLTGSGVALLLLFKTNKNRKENLSILALLYIIGSISGVIIELLSLL